jgi:hypothetical protein
VIFVVLLAVFKGPDAVSAQAYTKQTEIMQEQTETLTDIKHILTEHGKRAESEVLAIKDLNQSIDDLKN